MQGEFPFRYFARRFTDWKSIFRPRSMFEILNRVLRTRSALWNVIELRLKNLFAKQQFSFPSSYSLENGPVSPYLPVEVTGESWKDAPCCHRGLGDFIWKSSPCISLFSQASQKRRSAAGGWEHLRHSLHIHQGWQQPWGHPHHSLSASGASLAPLQWPGPHTAAVWRRRWHSRLVLGAQRRFVGNARDEDRAWWPAL